MTSNPEKLVYEKFYVHEKILRTRNCRSRFIKNLLPEKRNENMYTKQPRFKSRLNKLNKFTIMLWILLNQMCTWNLSTLRVLAIPCQFVWIIRKMQNFSLKGFSNLHVCPMDMAMKGFTKISKVPFSRKKISSYVSCFCRWLKPLSGDLLEMPPGCSWYH